MPVLGENDCRILIVSYAMYLLQICRHTDQRRLAFGSNDKNAVKYCSLQYLHDRIACDVTLNDLCSLGVRVHVVCSLNVVTRRTIVLFLYNCGYRISRSRGTKTFR